jgi:hypothetical protein
MKYLACLLAILFVLATPVLAVEAVSIGYSVADATVRPGGQTNIQLTVSNPGTASTPSYINIFITPGPYLTVDPSTLTIASLGLGSSQLTNVNVRVSPNAISTTSYVTIKATYIVDGTSRDTTITIPVKIRRSPVLQIENVTYSRQPELGVSTVLSFDITNSGEGPAQDVRVSVNQSSAISVTGSSGEDFVTLIGPYGKAHLEFPITISPTADTGLFNIPVTLSYYDETKSDQSTVLKYIGLALGGRTEFITTLDSAKNFYFGRQGTASVSIANAGNSPAEFLIVRTSSPYGSKEVYVGKLDSDETQTVDIPQDLSGASKPYNLTLELVWKDAFGMEYTDTHQIELAPTSAPIEIGAGTVIVLLVAAGAAWWYRKRIIAVVKDHTKK